MCEPCKFQNHRLQIPLLPFPRSFKATIVAGTGEQPSELSLAITEAKSILTVAIPMVATGLLLYSRSIISMLFLGRLGPLALAGGSLAIGFANITGYSVLSGLAIGMEPICGQAAGAGKPALLFLTLRRTVLLLLAASLPIAVTWSSIRPLLLLLGQSEDITRAAESYLLCSLPDLLLHSLLHPLRVFLRTQSLTLPLASSAAVALFLHFPTNYLLVTLLGLGIRGVAFAAVLTNLNLTLLLSAYVHLSGLCNRRGDHEDNEGELTHTCSRSTLIRLALPSCISVCLEWWWYEIMVLLCGLLLDPKSTVASMGILIQTTSFIYIFPSSLSFGISTQVSNQLGAGRPDRARRAAVVGIWCGAWLGATALCFAVAVRGKWALMFTEDADIAGLTAGVMPMLGLCELGNCPQTAGCGVLRGSARPGAGVKINLWAFYAVGMPVAAGMAFCRGWGFHGLWMGLLVAQGTCAALMVDVVRRTDWGMEAERARRLTGGELRAECAYAEGQICV